jgi:glycerate 2-kinase
MVRVLVAPDKFKGSLTAAEVCAAANEFLSVEKQYAVSMLPLADGGEGTFEILHNYFQGTMHEVIVHDPLMRKIKALYGISGDGKTAFIEMAKASGLQLLKPEERNPLKTTTFGTGELIAFALEKKVNTILLGLGGSATNDAGLGMAEALGYRFYELSGTQLHNLNGQSLDKVLKMDRSYVNPLLNKVKVIALCDVKNPLSGESGATRIFAPQKGATASALKILEGGMVNFENLLKSQFGFSSTFEGAGAAGGMGTGACFFLNAKLARGMDFVSDVTRLEDKISKTDIVITGEGKLDSQSLSGKVVQCVTELAKKHQKKVVALCGVLDLSEPQLRDIGIDECLVLSGDEDLPNSIKNAFALIKKRLAESRVLKVQ